MRCAVKPSMIQPYFRFNTPKIVKCGRLDGSMQEAVASNPRAMCSIRCTCSTALKMIQRGDAHVPLHHLYNAAKTAESILSRLVVSDG